MNGGFLNDLTLNGPADALEGSGRRGDGKQIQRLPQSVNGALSIKVYDQLSGLLNLAHEQGD